MDVFSRRAASRVASLRPACLSGGLMFTIMGRGSPISANTPAAQPPSVPPLLHVWKEMRWEATLTSCTARTGAPRRIRRCFSLGRWLFKIRRWIWILLFVTTAAFSALRVSLKRARTKQENVSAPCRHTQLPPLTCCCTFV